MNQDNQHSTGQGRSDDELHREMIDLSADLPDLGAVQTAVLVRAKTRARRRRGAALSLAVAAVVAVTVGTVAIGQSRSATSNVPVAVAASSTAVSSPATSGRASVTSRSSSASAAGAAPAAKKYAAENILLLGTDTRTPGGATSTGAVNPVMVMHLSADRQQISVLSIPRNTIIPTPTCHLWDPTTGVLSSKTLTAAPGEQFHITDVYARGGPDCTVNAVQTLTGLRIDRFVGIDFTGFQALVDSLGGITVNVCSPIVDNELGIVVPTAGTQKVTGAQALSLVRARQVVGESGSELAQIQRQQEVLAAMLRQVVTSNTLRDPAKLDGFLQVVIRNTFTANVTTVNLVELADSLGDLSPNQVNFYTLPTAPSTTAPGAVQAEQPQAQALTHAISGDQPISAGSAGAAAAINAGSAPCIGPVK